MQYVHCTYNNKSNTYFLINYVIISIAKIIIIINYLYYNNIIATNDMTTIML